MGSPGHIITILAVEAAVIAIIALFIKLVKRARQGKRGLLISGFLLLGCGIAPDPELEKNLRIMQEEKRDRGSEDESGDPPDPYTCD